MKGRKAIPVLMTISGLLIIAYPWISMKINQRHASKVLDGYRKEVKDYSKEKKQKMLKAAQAYNRKILDSNVIMTDPFDEEAQKMTTKEYEQTLDIDGLGMIGYLQIGKIDVSLPIYHGVSQKVLEKSAGHLQETGFPVKGQGVHSVLSAHTGMANARLFSDLDQLQEKDCFQVHVLDESLTYQIFKTEVVLPEEIASLAVEKERNLCTLVTCTPYGVNTHRLLVHGELIDVKKTVKKEKQRFPARKMLMLMSLVCVSLGSCLCMYPYLCQRKSANESEKRIKEFQRQIPDKTDAYRELRRRMEAYNRSLYENGQKDLKDVWSYEQSSFDLGPWGLKENMVGYIDIPEIRVRLPVYLGADQANMKKGAAHMSQTSLPVGGVNTNCVLAGHRGYAKAAMFQNLDLLKPGDSVYVTNLWETRQYQVKKKKVILPDAVDQILIQEGKDLITLITCNPYRHNYQRLVIYCEYKE